MGILLRKRQLKAPLRSFVFALSLLSIVTLATSDQALVIGIEAYKPLKAASTLKGCANDANSIAQALTKDGFKVTVLVNDKATKRGILGAFDQLKRKCKPTERFVFYYAGHGRSDPRYALMPSDATLDGNDISPKELNDAILAVPAKSRTVLLDSCFSGGMAAGEMSRGLLGDEFTSRNFDPISARSVKFGVPAKPTNQKDTTNALAANTGICYYTAALSSEEALEAPMPDGTRHGLFTYALLQNLKDGDSWGDVHSGVKKTMGDRLQSSGRTQNPMISTQFIGSGVFDTAKPDSKPPPTKTLLDVWNADNPDATKLALKLTPNQDVIEAGRQLTLAVQVNRPGFLVIFGQVGGHFYQFYPLGNSTAAADAAVQPGTVTFPTKSDRLFFDDFGADHLKAMLFSTQDSAQVVLDAMQGADNQPKALALKQQIEFPPYTSQFSVAVGDSLIGGLRLKNLEGLYKKVAAEKDGASKFLVARMQRAGRGYDPGLAWLAGISPSQPPSLTDKQFFMTLLNLAIQDGLLYYKGAMKLGQLPSKLGKDLDLAADNPPTGEKLWALNRAILAALYPKEVNADDARSN